MQRRSWSRTCLAAGIAIAASAFGTASASAAFPDFSDCPSTTANAAACVHVQSTGGSLDIKGFAVPIGTSFQIRGAITTFDSGNRFVAPRGTTGVFAKPIQVPGGLLGINFPIPGNAVTATAKLAGSTSNVAFDLGTLSLRIPLKLELSNVLLGMACKIGSDSSPVWVNLITGTTNPPAPNRPITGAFGTPVPTGTGLNFMGNTNVDNAFSIPSANSCGLGLGLINSLVNAKLKLPSAAGNNTMIVVNDIGLRFIA